MTAWIVAGHGIKFVVAAGLIRLHMSGVKLSCVERRSRLRANYWHCWLKITESIAVNSNITIFNLVGRFTVKCFSVVEFWTDLNSPISKMWGSASRPLCPLTTDILGRQFPSLRGTCEVTLGVARETALALSITFLLLVMITNIHEVKIAWFRPICRGLLSQWVRACANSTSNPSRTDGLGIWLGSYAPPTLWQNRS